ncbi:hypothetical protein OC846_004582 [Tilletia horrida]|uniref:Mid2 domain-containing protein n=1 Tax=Tilletia horrida TaxID=155126 RepID=A0AAN6GN20_9BASI|nr:hypothetical protein OC846_004582 [Tilletia horrida]KAK0568953.1 hypothetical protein OC861_001390 [Tilletia horrida]
MEPLQQQRRIHQHHAFVNHDYRSARPVDKQSRRSARLSSSQQDQDLLARSSESLNPRLIFGSPPDSGNSGGDTGGNGNGDNNGGTGGGKGHGKGNDNGGDGVTPHNGNDPTSGSGDGSGDGSGAGGATPTKTHKSETPTPTPVTSDTPTPTTTKTTKTKTEKTKSTTSTTTSTLTTPGFTFVLPTQSTVFSQVTSTSEPTTGSGFGSGSGQIDSANSKSSGSNSRTGLVIGVIAGVLVGIALLSVLVGFLVRKFKHKDDDPYENDPFDRVDFQRQSVMMPPDTFSEEDHHSAGLHSPEMTEQHQGMGMGSPFLDASPYTAAAVVGGAGAYERNQQLQSASSQATGGGPRPPTMFARHLDAHAGASSVPPMPNAPQVGGVYAPGEYTNTVVPSLPPIAAGSDAGASPFMGPGVVMGHANVASPYAHLDRARSAASQYVDLDRSGSGGSSAAGQPNQGQRSHSRQGVLDSMAEEHEGYQQQQSSYGAPAAQQYNHYDQYHGQQQQQQQQQQQHYGQYPQQHAEQDDNDDPYGGVSYH